MHVIAVDEAHRVVLNTQCLAEDPTRDQLWPSPSFRLQVRTSLDAGVILEFHNPETLQLLASATRSPLHAYRATRPKPAKRALRSTARPFALF